MNARDVVAAVAAVRGDAALVTGPGALAGAVFQASPHPATIYNMEFGYATATALGIALGAPDRRAVAIEGDGSFIASMSVLSTIARYRPQNLVVIVVDNGIYGTGTGTVATGSQHGTDIAAVGRACGLAESAVLAPSTAEELAAAVARAFGGPGPWLVHVRVDPDASRDSARRPRPGVDFVEASISFQAALSGRG
jgi:thiamine pyrophosphate-dependent acetolactate synthase large subunit-like protein